MTILKRSLNYISYDHDTGVFTWKPRIDDGTKSTRYFNTRFSGKEAGRKHIIGYREIEVNGVFRIFSHRAAWIITNGTIPEKMVIDHADGNRSNNQIANLRLATRSQNLYNARLRDQSESGRKNVWKDRKGWVVRIQFEGWRINSHSFDTIEEATVAAAEMRTRLHGDFARHQ